MGRKLLYIDESGNTGPNYNDQNERYFILAGWLDTNDVSNDINFINQLKSIFQVNEGKSNNLVKSSSGREKMKQVLGLMFENNFKPFLAIANKKYCIAARIIEVLLDPCYNLLVAPTFENNYPKVLEIKNDLAHLFYDCLEDSILINFANVYRGKKMNYEDRMAAMKKCIIEIADSLRRCNKTELASIVKGSLTNIDKLIDDDKSPHKTAYQTPNIWLFSGFVQMVEKYANLSDYTIEIIHDEQKEYGEDIYHTFNILHTKDQSYYGGIQIPHISAISFQDSKSNLLIQTADILAGSVNMVLKGKYNDKHTVDMMKQIIPLMNDLNNTTFFVEHYNVWNDYLIKADEIMY